jgi:formate C-acetyltransferase
MAIKAFFPHFLKMLRYLTEQLNATYYLVNEAGGIGHFLPNYEKMIKLGVEEPLKEMESKNGDFHAASRIACEALLILADRFAGEAERSADKEKDPGRAAELKGIARICRNVPRKPAATFQEALQSLWFTHMAANMEGLNSAISFGRVD